MSHLLAIIATKICFVLSLIMPEACSISPQWIIPIIDQLPTTGEEIVEQKIPLYPLSRLPDTQDVTIFRLTVPMHVKGYRIQLVRHSVDGTPSREGYDIPVFPADVYLVRLPDGTIKTFLARSPHSGAPLEFDRDLNRFKADWDGSEFELDGTWHSGPSSRNLDEFPVFVEGNMIWISNSIEYGEEYEGASHDGC